MQAGIILQFSPLITEDSSPHVHHILVYLCGTIEPSTLNSTGSRCDSAPADVRGCRYQAIAAWAIGGTVSLQTVQFILM